MSGRDLIVVGASAGGVEALSRMAGGLSDDVPAAFLVVVHSAPDAIGILPEVLRKASTLPAMHAVDGEHFRHGRFYVAPPDHHLLVSEHRLRVVHGPKENGFRPAVDPLFRTAARAQGPRVVGVVLSGGLDDGTYGLQEIKRCGGLAVVQHVDDALVPSMPVSAMRNVDVDHIVPAAAMGPLIAHLAEGRLPTHRGRRANGRRTADVAIYGAHAIHHARQNGRPSPFTCPECGGVLWETNGNGPLEFRCHVGHGFTAETLGDGQQYRMEAALWTALRALEESAELRRRMGRHAREGGLEGLARSYEVSAEEAERQAGTIRAVVTGESPAAAKAVPAARAARRHGRARAVARRRERSARR